MNKSQDDSVDTTTDFRSRLQQALAVAAEPSPDAEPFKNHYAARDLFHALLASPLSPLEAALVQSKLGATHLHVEEPHNAQQALETAARFLAPELLAFAANVDDEDETSSTRSKSDVDALLAELPSVRVDGDRHDHAIDILELLNQLGILWSNRARPLRALCFFHACETLCATQYETLALATQYETLALATSDSDNDDDKDDELLAALRDVRAHTNFYLAQVFGALNLPGASAQFCLATLELQLRALLSPVDADNDDDDDGNSESAARDHVADVQDWVKNCLRLVDYYVAADNWSDAAVGLAACDRLLARDVERGADASDVETIHVQRAETQLNWAKLHHAALRAAQLRDEGFPTATVQPASSTAERMALTLAADKNASDDSTKDDSTLSLGMRHVPATAITSFDAARDVFKMGMRACDRAKHVFVLDGFVTQHVRVLQLESALYKRLVHFERDRKRQVAMQLRRLAILTPVLATELNTAAYTALLQEVNYECAEIAADVFDLKQDKTPSDREGECDDKANAYALKAVHWYQQYVLLFYPPPCHHSTDQQPPQVVKTGAAVQLPSTAMSAHEFRSVLLGYFGLARVCGRLQFGKAHKDKTVLFWKQSLAYHEAVLELVRQFERAQAASAGAGQGPDEAAALHELFDAELTISTEMVELLPEKINQLVYNDKLL